MRNLLKNKLYSIINIVGLAVGIACSLLILLWVQDEVSYDKFIPKSERLYQVYVNAEFDDKVNTWRSVPLPTYEAMKDADVHIVNSVVTGWGGEQLLTVGEKRILKDGIFVSEEFLEMFEFEVLQGDPATALDDPTSIVLTESLAKDFFGAVDPINKIVRVNDETDLKVVAILKDVPQNSSFEFEFLLPWKYRETVNQWVVRNKTNWGNYSFQVFVELDGADHKALAQSAIEDMLTKNGQDDIVRKFFIHPMLDWRLYSKFEDGVVSGGMYEYVRLFSLIAVFILIIACVNFMNLATARSEKRAKEVGIRKSIGSKRRELVFQFMMESTFIAFVSFLLAVILAEIAMPFYSQLVDKKLFLDYGSSSFWMYTAAMILITGFVSGSYPALYLSSFSPIKTLKGKVKIGKGASTPRKVLVTLQFVFAILLMIGTTVIYRQISVVKDRDLGYEQKNLITLRYTDDIEKNYKVLKTELLQSGAVDNVNISNSAVTTINSNNFLGWPGKPEEQRVIFSTIATEFDYAATLGIEMLMGRDFSEDFKSDTSAIIINKAALDLMQLEDPVGTELDLWGEKRKLIGVIDNVLMESVHGEIRPMFMIYDPDWINALSIRLAKGKSLSTSLSQVKEIMAKYNPAYPFDYQFADQEFDKKYKSINMTQQLAGMFALLALVITGLGIFGLASYTAEQRTKEIGIRKVLGAPVLSLITLMTNEFSKLVGLSFLLSAPLSYYLMDQYLEQYEIRTGLEWWVFVLTGVLVLFLVVSIAANQAFRAAQANPVKSLQSE